MKNRTLVFTMLFAAMTSGLYAQQEKPLHYYQVGVNFSSLNSFGLDFKTGSEKTLFRLSLLSLNFENDSRWGRSQDSIDIKNQSYGFGVRLGFERHLPIVAHLNFIWGLGLGCDYRYQKQNQETRYYYNNRDVSTWNLTPQIYAIAGVTYTVGDHLVIGAEITPAIRYTYGISKQTSFTSSSGTSEYTETTTSTFSFSASNLASLSLAYRFGK
jgi:hypothetical protein